MNSVSTRSLRDTLTDQAESRSLSIQELARRADMPERYVGALLSGDIQSLPALPYLRTSLARLAEILGLSAPAIIEQFKAEYAKMHSGAGDMLPVNRFALPSRRRYYILAAIACLLFMSVVGVARSGFLGSPQLAITYPSKEVETMRTTEALIILEGRITPGDALTINGAHVPVLGDGSFTSEYRLSPELNTLEFVARRFLGRTTVERRQVYYDVVVASSTTSALAPVSEREDLAPDEDSSVQ